MTGTGSPQGEASTGRAPPPLIRACRPGEEDVMLAIINQASQAYRGAIPADRWHDPYMPADELRSEILSGVKFFACEIEGAVAGVMGIQQVRNVALIRHAYVLPSRQGEGLGGRLLDHLRGEQSRQMLVGTWSAATWAVGFYERHGFRLVGDEAKRRLLRTYWTVPERQIETSVVLASPHLDFERARTLVEGAN